MINGKKGKRHEPGLLLLSSEYGCDWRLGRAAKEILRRHLENILRPNATHNSLRQLLQEAAFSPNDDCPLRGDDMDEHERLGRVIYSAFPSRLFARLAMPRFQSNTRQLRCYLCPMCGKSFSTLFYLDRHLDNVHSDRISSFCAADWCNQFLSVQSCHDMAFDLEPYYGPGGGEHGPEARVIKHSWFQQAHSLPCRERNLEQARLQCEQVVNCCFTSDRISQPLLQRLCGALSCKKRLHRLFTFELTSFFGTHTCHYIYDPQPSWVAAADDWAMIHSQNQLGKLSVLALVLLTALYSSWAVLMYRKKQSRDKRNSSLLLSRGAVYRKPYRLSSVVVDSKKRE